MIKPLNPERWVSLRATSDCLLSLKVQGLLRWGLKILDHVPDPAFEAHLQRCLGEHDLAQWSPKVDCTRPCVRI